MIRLSQITMPVGHTHEALVQKCCKALKITAGEMKEFRIVKQSVDARKMPDIIYSYVVDISCDKEAKVLAKSRLRQAELIEKQVYRFPKGGEVPLTKPIVIIGMGPAGLFCGYMLAKHGYKPVILERGQDVDTRTEKVTRFWETGVLDTRSNVQFGEGGAGTFSDGKLNTLVKDKSGRNLEVLSILVENGAPEHILYDAKPHIGTDVLSRIVKRMREKILAWGGDVRFESQVTDFRIENDQLIGVQLENGDEIMCAGAVLAIGHSARDTFETLYELGVPMEAKAFAVGFRVEHPQSLINQSQYGVKHHPVLGAAPYKVVAKTSTGRGVYSFCMCPGGYVVNASSEEGRLAVNGMSYSGRDGANANSAIIVAVTPEDFGSDHPLAGVAFQRRLEEKAFVLGGGKVPVERYGSFKHKVILEATSGISEVRAEALAEATKAPAETSDASAEISNVPEKISNVIKRTGDDIEAYEPCIKGAFVEADLTGILPADMNRAFVEGMEHFDRIIPGFAAANVWMDGVESRTSSPVRIIREEDCQSAIKGLYPCGEGAGYAGGITSAAMDGLKVAEQLAAIYRPISNGAE